MKRSASAPCLAEEDNSKKRKTEESSPEINEKDYLDLLLSKVTDLQKQISENIYVTDNSNAHDDDDDVLKEVLTKIFKDSPGTSKSISNVIDSLTKPSLTQIIATRHKMIQLSGFTVCRKLAFDFLRQSMNLPAKYFNNPEGLKKYRNTIPKEVQSRLQILKNLDLHLATKQSDYTAQLMRE